VQHAWDRRWSVDGPVAIVVGIVVLLLVVFAPTTLTMVDVWRHSNTYGHCFIVVPAFAWLVWRRRADLASLPVRPFWPALPLLAGAGLVWLAGDSLAAAGPSQFALIAMAPLAVAAVLGVRWVRALAFPFAFLFLAVPFGESLIPPLMDRTADFTVAALELSGIPVYREGTTFTIPSGTWSVVESCSGIRYLFACTTIAALYAWIVLHSTTRRLLFVAAAAAIAIVANWVRAYSIVMVGHLFGVHTALVADHVVYGALFFGVVMALVFALGSWWRDDRPGDRDEASSGRARPGTMASVPRQGVAAALASAVVVCIWPLMALATPAATRGILGPIPEIQPRAGWVRGSDPGFSWRPQTNNPAQQALQSFVKNGQLVSVHVAVYGRPTADSKIFSSSNRLVAVDSKTWRQVERGQARLRGGDDTVRVGTATLLGPEGRIVAWRWYWVNGTMTDSPARAALAQALARLQGQSEVAALVTVFKEEDDSAVTAALALEPFASEMLASIEAALRLTASGSGKRPD